MKKLTVFCSCMLLYGSAAMANLSGSDDFNDNAMDTNKWLIVSNQLTEISGHLEFSASGSNREEGSWAWIANQGSQYQNWSTSIDVYNDSTPSLPGQICAVGMVAVNTANDDTFGIMLAVDGVVGHGIAGGWEMDGIEYWDSWIPTTSISAKLKIDFDAGTKELSCAYDTGSGYDTLTNFSVSGWSMSPTDTFLVAIAAFTENSAEVSSGQVYADNFEAITIADSMTVQEAYLKASNTDEYDEFGTSVAISDDTIVIGASYESSAATGTNSNQTDNSEDGAGAVYVFVRTGNSWVQQAYLKASNTDPYDYFGESVAISGDTIVVGARGEESASTGVNGDQSDNTAYGAGAAYVFVRDGTNWSQQAYLKASNTDSDDQFGIAVGLSGNTLIVGANNESSSASGVNGDQEDNSSYGAGAAYVFVRNGTNWSQQAYLKASNTDVWEYDRFGESVAISGNTIVVGSAGEDSAAIGINGDQADNNAYSSGAAYVFVREDTNWSQQAYLKASNTDSEDEFGISTAISSNTIIIGAHHEDSAATGVNGNHADNSASWTGAAYVFERNGTDWSQQAYLKASNPDDFDMFGRAVSISGDTLVVGAWGEESASMGVNGDQSSNDAYSAGAAYVFVRNNMHWNQQTYIKASNTGESDEFGISTAIFRNNIVVGAWHEESAATGVNGNQMDNSASWAGAAYVFSDLGLNAFITNCAPVASGFMIEWLPIDGGDSMVKWSSSLGTIPFTNLSVWLPYPQHSYTDTFHGAEASGFYQVEVEMQ